MLAACSPPVHYHGPKSDHFDGRHFFNPDGEQGTGGAQHEGAVRYLDDALFHPRDAWPLSVPVTRGVPPLSVTGGAMLVTWIGHSTVLVQADGLNILTDPVWVARASPVQFAGPRRVRVPGVRFRDLPKIDLVLISHDHYDHMDMKTLGRLWARDRPAIVTGLGNDIRLAGENIPAIARDWGQSVVVRPGITVTLDRVHHWSARSERDRDDTLWTGFTVTLPGGNLYFAGDTGPGDMRWALPVAAQGPVRLALLPIGAIHAVGPATGNHIGPIEAVTAFQQLHAGSALGIHWGTFELTDEPIDLPPTLLRRTLAARHIAPDRFRATQAGERWWIPPLPATSVAAAPRIVPSQSSARPAQR